MRRNLAAPTFCGIGCELMGWGLPEIFPVPEWVGYIFVLLGVVCFFIAMVFWLFPETNDSELMAVNSGSRITVLEAMCYMVQKSRWGWAEKLKLRGDILDVAPDLALYQLRNAAQRGDILFRGKRWDRQESEEIDPDMWNQIRISAQGNYDTTESAVSSAVQPPVYANLVLFENGVHSKWPRASSIYKISVKLSLIIVQAWWLICALFKRLVSWFPKGNL